MKFIIRLSVFCFLIFPRILYSQDSKQDLNHAFVFSIKGGYTIPPLGDIFFPGGIDISMNADIPFGKGFFFAANFDGLGGSKGARSYSGYNIDGILKYRINIKKLSFGIGTGLGYSNLDLSSAYVNYEMLNFTAQAFADYFLFNSVSISSEISFYGMSTIDWGGGSGKSNRIIEFKIGISLFPNL